ncbi:molybdate ABC transporter permease subunit [Vandammella animalimorsus]|uniref:Molybdenum transport system permease n=1 Tax=Vandammella animalimorsus TaxID=2029117 RepID=A0A3M6RKI5_9BURK|nr:molybdate ABC transporter permease subunit [Vandammella animalimorsus]RMX15920.1 molybdate ABC transporter permease subunit [Vandammella animalimorsus]
MTQALDTAAVIVPLLLSLKVAFWATCISGLLGIVVGLYLARSRCWLRNVLDTVLTLPMVLPPTVMGYYLLVLLGSKGWLGAWLKDSLGISLIFSWQGAVVAAAVVSFPLVFKPARAAFESVDPQLEQAGRVLGVSEWGIVLRISLPLAWRGIMAGMVLGFVRALGEFGATLMIAGSIPGKTQTLSIAIYEAVQAGRDGTATLLALVISGVCVGMLLLATWITPKRQEARGA